MFSRSYIDVENAKPFRTWIGDPDRAALLDLRSGRLLGYFCHDGHGKWEAYVCVPLWKAQRITRSSEGLGEWHIVDFPRCWVPLRQTRSWEHGAHLIETICGEPVLPAYWTDESEEAEPE